MKKTKIAIVLALFAVMAVEAIQGCDRETFVALSVVASIVILIPVRHFRWLGPVSTIVAMMTFGLTGCVTRNNVVTKSVTPGPWGTNVVTQEDKSWSVNQLGSSVNNHRNGNLLHFRAAVGGGVPPVGGNGYPVVTVPIESQRFHQEETWRRYGLDGSGGGQGYHNGNNTIDSDIQKFYNLSGPGGSGRRGYGY